MFSWRLFVNTLIVGLGLFGLMGRPAAEVLGGLSDPTRPSGWRPATEPALVEESQSISGLQLQGTFSSAGQRSAMISGRRVTVGDQVSGAEVVEIEKNKVILRIDGETVELASLLPRVKSPTRMHGESK